ncbi:hypothetical protein ACA910_006405 [Epithemia clementina (nom. ined.)]
MVLFLFSLLSSSHPYRQPNRSLVALAFHHHHQQQFSNPIPRRLSVQFHPQQSLPLKTFRTATTLWIGSAKATTTTTRWLATTPSSSSSSSSTTTTTTSSDDGDNDLEARIQAKGNEIRALKEAGADKATVAPLVEELLALKAAQLNSLTMADGGSAATQTLETKDNNNNDNDEDTSTSDFITARAVDYSKWYNDLIRVTGLAENSPVRGCMIIKPWGMSIWDRVRTELDSHIQHHGAQNAYFPLLIPQSFLSKEAEHVDGFAKECAVVTHHRLTSNPNGDGTLIPDPDAQLEEPLIIRPTSETVIWHTFRKWIRSHRDLPLKINQWANVMRWELRTRPFLRTSEFLWQEGHTAHATSLEAQEEAQTMIGIYANPLCRDLLALPVITGVKSPSERFAGAQETYTIEALMPNGWALQSGTSHFLGQSFGQAFNVTFQGEQEGSSPQVVWGTSWGVSTRLLGALIMTHSDDAGLVLPPKVAPVQIVIVPIPLTKKQQGDDALVEQMATSLQQLQDALKAAQLRVQVDARDYMRPGAKYFEWERKGVPLRIELGPRDVQQGVCVFKYRAPSQLAAEKQTISLADAATTAVQGLADMQQALYDEAAGRLQMGICRYDDDKDAISYDEFKAALQNDVASKYPGQGLFLVPWKCNAENEAQIKEECQATLRCYPLAENNPNAIEGKRCFYSGEPATHMALFGRAF